MPKVILGVELDEGCHSLREIDWQSLLHAPIEESEDEGAAKPRDDATPDALQKDDPDPEPEDPSVEELLAEAARAAHEDGHRKGREEAEQLLRSELANAIEAITSAASQAAQVPQEDLLQLEGQVVSLALTVAERVIHRELEADDEMAVRVVKEALAGVASARQLHVRLSPHDLAAVQKAETELRAQLAATSELVLESDESVQPGGCLVTCELGEVNATLAERVRHMRQELLETAPSAGEKA